MTTNKHPSSTIKLALMAAIAVASVGLCASSQAAQASATATATASGTVVAPIAIAATANLAFGSLAPGAGGNVTVSTSGVRASTGPILLGGAPSSAARFHITGQADSTYTITHSGTAVLTNTTGSGGETMALTKFSDLTGANGTSGSATSGTLDILGSQTLFVGGSIAVASNQVAGVYTGTVTATVEYN